MGRKKIIIDWKKVDKLLQAQCLGSGIATLLGLHPETLYSRCLTDHGISFTDYASEKKGAGKELLRMKQYEKAMGGDKTMLVWLGKQYLDQREKTDTNFHVDDQAEKNRQDLLEKMERYKERGCGQDEEIQE